MQEPVYIPQRVDETPNLLIWSMDEAVPILLGLVVGIMLGQALICSLVGLVMTYWYRKYRGSHPDGFFVHIFYWYGVPGLSRGRLFVNPFCRRFLP